ncbi:EamA/RhaT family transporter [Photobacterium frigidiphilum]|uniref:EamA/RhaT family transporter n=1 Tax=Photobacterium frigidiphilum TaxID=264736 RepID=A0A2T3JC12_9GAMM|nr:DMT family transporter [Photobacterium frigidiphilum]PSU46394.1 EamA/RhaT family transporter [Photobacterium frigidiphilum]
MEIQKRKEFGLGLMAMGVTLLIWASFFISLRASSQSALTIGDIALLRFLPAALVFGWLALPKAIKIKQTPKRYLLAIALGAGLPFLLLAANGLRLAPVADGASLIPGILPLFVTSIAAICYRERISSMRKAGIMLIFLGICLFLATSLLSGSGQIATGHALLLMASFSWAWFTIAMRVSGLTPIEGGAVLSLSACICLPVLYLLGFVDFNLLNAPSSEIAFHFMIQGIAAGLIANFTFGYAISRLGAEMSAALGSFTPVLAALIAVPMFTESLNMNTILAMMLIVLGAISASEIITTKKVAIKVG